MRGNKYASYLHTKHWRETRKFIYAREGGCCANCGNQFGLVVHHLTYARLGSEDMSDLILLCKTCHHKLHNLSPEDTETDNSHRCFFCSKPTGLYRESDLKLLCNECYQLMVENEFISDDSSFPHVTWCSIMDGVLD